MQVHHFIRQLLSLATVHVDTQLSGLY